MIASVVVFSLFTWIYKLLCKKAKDRSSKAYDGKVVVITGCSSGIGNSLALLYAKMGATVVLSARREKELQTLAEECKKAGAGSALVVVTDVSKESDCKSLIEKTIANYKKIDVLILNAGVSSMLTVSEMPDLVAQRELFEINYWGCVYCAFHARKYLEDSKGSICVTSSLLGKQSAPSRSMYSASKHALHGFFNALRMELEGKVSVTIACPGFVYSEIHENALGKGSKVERDTSQFMSSEECASIMVEAIEDHVAEEVMTMKGKIGVYLKPFIPDIVDNFAKKQILSVKKTQ
jgi:short-subunit dehydrogenase